MTDISNVIHEESKQRFVLKLPNQEEALLEYKITIEKGKKVMNMYHTFSPPSQRGKGIAAVVTKAAFEWAEKNGIDRVIPSCSYIHGTFLLKNEEYYKLVEK
eukprot:TRINITY_DN6904_c0_g1_i1.p1 TRINITY_DN6904_c0_g1~~TRINITY_DN6904_c0_g1_i1.p1  ORF type:complete len:102 (-),score=20.77 TRINITY_DN6904_c0_g1_i1:102-407(-)